MLEVKKMSESPDNISDGMRWGSRLAVVGVLFAALSVAVSAVGIDSIALLYWAGILLSISGVAGAAIRGAQYFSIHYAGGVISTMAGVFVTGYGIENQTHLTMLVGVVVFVVGALGVVADTQRSG